MPLVCWWKDGSKPCRTGRCGTDCTEAVLATCKGLGLFPPGMAGTGHIMLASWAFDSMRAVGINGACWPPHVELLPMTFVGTCHIEPFIFKLSNGELEM